MLPRGEGPGAPTAAGGLLERLPYRHRRRRCGDFEGFLVLLPWGGNQAEMAKAIFPEVHRDGTCRTHEGGEGQETRWNLPDWTRCNG